MFYEGTVKVGKRFANSNGSPLFSFDPLKITGHRFPCDQNSVINRWSGPQLGRLLLYS
jgi:hypothetical protein